LVIYQEFLVIVLSEVTVWLIKFFKCRMFDKTHGTSMYRCVAGNRLVEISSWRLFSGRAQDTGWAKSRYTVIFFFFTGIVNDGRELKYRTKKVDCEAVYYILYTYFWPTFYMSTPSLSFSWMNCTTWSLYTNQSVTLFFTLCLDESTFVYSFSGKSVTVLCKAWAITDRCCETNTAKLTLTNTLWSRYLRLGYTYSSSCSTAGINTHILIFFFLFFQALNFL
jgi:hypothetical protein